MKLKLVLKVDDMPGDYFGDNLTMGLKNFKRKWI